MSLRTLVLRRPRSGGQLEGVVSIGDVWYVDVFGSIEEARAFATKHSLELTEPPEDANEVPEVPAQNNGNRR